MGTLPKSGHVEVVADATPEAIWEIVSDITRVGEWSHECKAGVRLDGATSARPGARFKGTNKNGRQSWSRSNEVVSVDAPRELSWKTVPTRLYADSTVWTFTLEPVDGGTRIVQRFQVLKINPLLDRLFYALIPKHRDRTDALRDDIRRLGEVARTGVPVTD